MHIVCLKIPKWCMYFSFSSDSALPGGRSFKDSFSIPDPIGQVSSTGFEREERESFMKQGNKESINPHLIPITLPSSFVFAKIVLYVTKNVHFHELVIISFSVFCSTVKMLRKMPELKTLVKREMNFIK